MMITIISMIITIILMIITITLMIITIIVIIENNNDDNNYCFNNSINNAYNENIFVFVLRLTKRFLIIDYCISLDATPVISNKMPYLEIDVDDLHERLL